jgi:arylformamidase
MDEWLDVSIPIHGGMVTWPGSAPARVDRTSRIDHGHNANVSRLSMDVHTGTHVDAPVHFLPGGAGIDAQPFDRLIGPARVIDVGDARRIDRALLASFAPAAGERLLFRTSNSVRGWGSPTFIDDFVHLTTDGARAAVERGVITVGIDYLSIASPSEGVATHHVLLGAGVCVIEGLDLRAAPAGAYDMICLPLRIAGGDGAPARVVLRPRRA